ncbi:MAG: hypothetical protein AAF721_13160 [Myxococcota bacterium]
MAAAVAPAPSVAAEPTPPSPTPKVESPPPPTPWASTFVAVAEADGLPVVGRNLDGTVYAGEPSTIVAIDRRGRATKLDFNAPDVPLYAHRPQWTLGAQEVLGVVGHGPNRVFVHVDYSARMAARQRLFEVSARPARVGRFGANADVRGVWALANGGVLVLGDDTRPGDFGPYSTRERFEVVGGASPGPRRTGVRRTEECPSGYPTIGDVHVSTDGTIQAIVGCEARRQIATWAPGRRKATRVALDTEHSPIDVVWGPEGDGWIVIRTDVPRLIRWHGGTLTEFPALDPYRGTLIRDADGRPWMFAPADRSSDAGLWRLEDGDWRGVQLPPDRVEGLVGLEVGTPWAYGEVLWRYDLEQGWRPVTLPWSRGTLKILGLTMGGPDDVVMETTDGTRVRYGWIESTGEPLSRWGGRQVWTNRAG